MFGERLAIARNVLETRALHNQSLMEMATTAKVLDTIPQLKSSPRIVAVAARLGGSYDDLFDYGVDRQAVVESSNGVRGGILMEDSFYMNGHLQAFRDFLREVEQSPLEKDEKLRLFRTSIIFTSNIAAVEFEALSFPESCWSTNRSIEYRRAVCLIWAMFFSALGSGEIQLEKFNPNEGVKGPGNHYSRYLTEENREARWVQELYYDAVVYQFVGDWMSRYINRRRFIPGLASLNQENEPLGRQEYQGLLNESIAEARSNGMGLDEEVFIRLAFPLLRFLANLRLK